MQDCFLQAGAQGRHARLVTSLHLAASAFLLAAALMLAHALPAQAEEAPTPTALHVAQVVRDSAITASQAAQTVATQATEEAKPCNVALKAAHKLIGVAYRPGGSTPAGFDCSGFTMYVYGKAGIKLTHNAQTQYDQTPSVKGKLKRGDLVFFGSSTSSINHVGIYVRGGKFIHSPHSGAYVRIEGIKEHGSYVGATRPY